MEGSYGAHKANVFSARGSPGINLVGISLAFLLRNYVKILFPWRAWCVFFRVLLNLPSRLSYLFPILTQIDRLGSNFCKWTGYPDIIPLRILTWKRGKNLCCSLDGRQKNHFNEANNSIKQLKLIQVNSEFWFFFPFAFVVPTWRLSGLQFQCVHSC